MKKENVSDDDYMPDKDVDFEFDENKPHRCPHCSKSFRKKSNLYGHIKKVHEGERPYPCHLCKKSFKMKQHLNKHIAGRHGIEGIYYFGFFFSRVIHFFASFSCKLVKVSWLVSLGQNFDDYPCFQLFFTVGKHF